MNMRRVGQRWSRLRARSAALHRRCIQWVGRAERDSGHKSGLSTDVAARLKTLERENRGLRQANEILRKASAYFAQAELDRRYKP